MKKARSILVFVLLSISSQVWSAALSDFLPGQFSVLSESFLQETGAPGVSVAVAFDGRLQFTAGYGSADLEHGVPATAETTYRTASIAKPMTAVAVMQLACDR
jgi:CubicO group peptidase (beta-lactamase class C family)